MLLRPATSADLEGLLELERVHGGDAFSRSQLRYLLSRANGATWIAEAQQECGGTTVTGSVMILYRRLSGWAHLYSLTVSPHWQGRGVGRALLERAQEDARSRGLRGMRLEVRSDNARARALYAGAGFLVTGERPHYYHDGCSAILMSKSFGEP